MTFIDNQRCFLEYSHGAERDDDWYCFKVTLFSFLSSKKEKI